MGLAQRLGDDRQRLFPDGELLRHFAAGVVALAGDRCRRRAGVHVIRICDLVVHALRQTRDGDGLDRLARVGLVGDGVGHRQRRRRDGQLRVGKGDGVVAARAQRADVDRVAADVLALHTGQCSAQAVAVHQPPHRVGQRRVGLAVGLAPRVRGDHQRLLADRQIRTGKADGVVFACAQRTSVDRVAADVLTRRARQRTAQAVAAHQAAHIVAQLGIRLAVGLALRVRGDRQRPLADHQARASEDDRVVVARRQRALANRVAADTLARLARQHSGQLVAAHQADGRVG